MINQVILIGHVGGDPELRYTPKGTPSCRFSLATRESWKDAQGERQEKTAWHRCQAWGKLADICQQYLHKGSRVYISGKLDYGSYEKDGVKHYTTDIVVREMKMLDRREGGPGPRENAPEPAYTPGGPEEDIPF